MDAIDINYGLAKNGSSQTRLAAELGCKPQTVNRVIHGTTLSYRIASHIAHKIGVDIDELWPGRYDRQKVA